MGGGVLQLHPPARSLNQLVARRCEWSNLIRGQNKRVAK